MKASRIRVQLDFTVELPEGHAGLPAPDIVEFAAAGLRTMLAENQFPIDILGNARFTMTDVSGRRRKKQC